MNDFVIRRAVLFLLIAILATVAVGFVLKTGISLPGEADLSVGISDATESLHSLFKVMGTFGGTVLALAVSAALAIMPRTRRLGLVCLFVTVLLWFCVDVLMKYAVCRPRPYVYLGIEPLLSVHSEYSYPSCHTAVVFAFCGFFLRKLSISMPLLAYGILMAVSRVSLYLHYVSDCICGAAFGLIFGLLMHIIITRYLTAKDLLRSLGY